uniref:CHORD domain-containing protein n=1 Tax=Aureoumbra lagunensis TaxID=44058 RepID=A0A7S3JTH4_9STRA|mmetsp:Transcript_14034/g.18727  ORF Transcript_14034/g.18727 Transcript_14034/m.18727 type:complete len:290 (+) Transcript_14034:233-1102(+)
MKVYIHYVEPAATSLHQTLKITLPRKWEDGPIKNLLETFVKNYNDKHPENELEIDGIRLETEMLEYLSPSEIVKERINDRADLYIKLGARANQSSTARDLTAGGLANTGIDELDIVRVCKHFGCQKKFTLRTNFDGECRYHSKPPVFHETAKYWSCCPHKKVWDFDSFVQIPGCCTGRHSDQKPIGNQYLGGNELRGNTASQAKLKTVDEFNAEQNGTAEKPLDLLKRALVTVGCSASDFDKARAELNKRFPDNEKEVMAEFATEFSFGLHNVIGTTGGTGPPPVLPTS